MPGICKFPFKKTFVLDVNAWLLNKGLNPRWRLNICDVIKTLLLLLLSNKVFVDITIFTVLWLSNQKWWKRWWQYCFNSIQNCNKMSQFIAMTPDSTSRAIRFMWWFYDYINVNDQTDGTQWLVHCLRNLASNAITFLPDEVFPTLKFIERL